MAAGYFNFTGTQSFTANSLGTGTGGNVTINSTYTGNSTPLTIGASTTLQAKSTSGSGGTVAVVSASQPVTVTGSGISVAAGASGTGAGGNISVTSSANTLTTIGEFDAQSFGSGNAGTIELTSNGSGTSGDVSIGGNLDVSANGTGNAGTITVNGTDVTVTSGIALNAFGTAQGNGGTITINNTNLIDLSQITINAKGGDTGGGGDVTIASIGNFDVNAVISVDSDDDLCGGVMCAVAPSKISPRTPVLSGSITLNSDKCSPIKTGNTTWPTKYWNCVDPAAPTTEDGYPASVAFSNLTPSLRAHSGTNKLYIYVFKSNSDFNQYFHLGANPSDQGDTWKATEGSMPGIYSAVFEYVQGGTNPLSEKTFKEITIHELGHAFDILFGQATQSEGDSYKAYVYNDFLNLDYALVNTGSQSLSVLRRPCEVTPKSGGGNYPGLPPFQNIPTVCTGTVLNSTYTGMTNHAILQAIGPYWYTAVNPLWTELYAQALAYDAYAVSNPIANFAYVAPDNVYKNGYFTCTYNWADRVRQGFTSPSGGTACSSAVPTWYTF